MIRRLPALILGACLALAGAGPAFAQAAPAEQRLALVIGNAAYGKQALKNPANDARVMAASLRKLGFQVIERIDAGKKSMEDAILEFGEKLKAGGVGLFYYAGHGVQVRGHNYLVPLDASLPSEASVRVQAVDVDLVLEQMTEARNRANVVILDACRNNPFLAQRRGAGAGLAAIDAARGRVPPDRRAGRRGSLLAARWARAAVRWRCRARRGRRSRSRPGGSAGSSRRAGPPPRPSTRTRAPARSERDM